MQNPLLAPHPNFEELRLREIVDRRERRNDSTPGLGGPRIGGQFKGQDIRTAVLSF